MLYASSRKDVGYIRALQMLSEADANVHGKHWRPR